MYKHSALLTAACALTSILGACGGEMPPATPTALRTDTLTEANFAEIYNRLGVFENDYTIPGQTKPRDKIAITVTTGTNHQAFDGTIAAHLEQQNGRTTYNNFPLTIAGLDKTPLFSGTMESPFTYSTSYYAELRSDGQEKVSYHASFPVTLTGGGKAQVELDVAPF